MKVVICQVRASCLFVYERKGGHLSVAKQSGERVRFRENNLRQSGSCGVHHAPGAGLVYKQLYGVASTVKCRET